MCKKILWLKYLGLIYDDSLTWILHVNTLGSIIFAAISIN